MKKKKKLWSCVEVEVAVLSSPSLISPMASVDLIHNTERQRQRGKKAALAPWSNAARTAVGQLGGPSEIHILHADHRIDHLRHNLAEL